MHGSHASRIAQPYQVGQGKKHEPLALPHNSSSSSSTEVSQHDSANHHSWGTVMTPNCDTQKCKRFCTVSSKGRVFAVNAQLLFNTYGGMQASHHTGQQH